MTGMKKYLSLFLVALTAIAFSACTDDDTQTVENTNVQTILVYMPWTGSETSNGLYRYFRENLDSIEHAIIKQKGMKNYRLLVYLSSSTTEASLYEVIYANQTCTHQVIKNYSDANKGTPTEITDLISTVKTEAPALNYSMIVGSHGTGWTQKEDWQQYPYRIKRHHNPAKRYAETRFFGSVADMNYAINIGTLAEAIANSHTKMQYILFDDCYMANVETAYALKDVTNFLVGSTSEVLIKGMPYASTWQYMATGTPNYASIVSTFYDYYNNYTIASGTLSAIDCRQMDALADCMKEINQTTVLDESLRDKIQVLDGFQAPIFFDMMSYVENLQPKTSLLSRFQNVYNKAIRATKSTTSLYSYLYDAPVYITVDTNSGLTISDPSLHTVAMKGKEHTAWWLATH